MSKTICPEPQSDACANDARPASWWTCGAALHRYVADLLAAELAQARPGRAPRPAPWPAELDLVADLGADSLDTVELVMEFEEEFDITIPDEEAEKIQTVGQAIAYIEEHSK